MMSNKTEFGFVVEYVTDLETSKRFFVEVLGLEVKRTSPVFIQFDHFAIASDASMSGNRNSELYWLVNDVEAAFKDISQKAEVIMPLKQLPFGKTFGIKDPAGQPLYLLEFAQNRPSELVK
jgi:predicted enzyme related to lactoylglutathione lyase